MVSMSEKLRNRIILLGFRDLVNYHKFKIAYDKMNGTLFNKEYTVFQRSVETYWHSACIYKPSIVFKNNKMIASWFCGGFSDTSRCYNGIEKDYPVKDDFFVHHSLDFFIAVNVIFVANLAGDILFDSAMMFPNKLPRDIDNLDKIIYDSIMSDVSDEVANLDDIIM